MTGRHDVSWTYTWIAHGARRPTIKTRATDDSGNIEHSGRRHDRQRRLPVLAVGHQRHPADGRSTATTRHRGRRQVQVRHLRHRSAASASTRRRRTPARTSAACGPPAARCSRGDVHQRDGLRLADRDVRQPGVDHARTRPTCVGYYAPDGHYSASTDYFYPLPPRRRWAARASTPRRCTPATTTPTAATACYAYASSSTFPTDLRRGQLLGRRDVRADAAARPGDGRHGDGRQRLGERSAGPRPRAAAR